MNQDNYASLEVSKRLVEAGIVLETDCVWAKIFPMREDSTWKILTKPEFDKAYYDFDPHYPAPLHGRSVEGVTGRDRSKWFLCRIILYEK